VKITRAKKRVLPEPLLKPKRLDLNEAQLLLQRQVSEISTEDLIFLEGEIHRILPPGALETCFRRKGLRYYRPQDLIQVLGVSEQTFDKYADGYLRLVRREGETPREFYARKVQANRPDAPLVKDLPEGAEACEDYRLISSRILIFLVLAPAQVKGNKPNFKLLRELLSGCSQLQVGRPLPIHKNSGVTTWEVSRT
jgi:hypothetical protein